MKRTIITTTLLATLSACGSVSDSATPSSLNRPLPANVTNVTESQDAELTLQQLELNCTASKVQPGQQQALVSCQLPTYGLSASSIAELKPHWGYIAADPNVAVQIQNEQNTDAWTAQFYIHQYWPDTYGIQMDAIIFIVELLDANGRTVYQGHQSILAE